MKLMLNSPKARYTECRSLTYGIHQNDKCRSVSFMIINLPSLSNLISCIAYYYKYLE